MARDLTRDVSREVELAVRMISSTYKSKYVMAVPHVEQRNHVPLLGKSLAVARVKCLVVARAPALLVRRYS